MRSNPNLCFDGSSPSSGVRGVLHRLAQWLASPKLTLAFFIATAAAALSVAEGNANPTVAMVTPLSLLVINLSSAIWVTPRLRTDLPLLVFHLALLALVALIIAGRLIYFDGMASVTRGDPFSGEFSRFTKGPLYAGSSDTIRFINEGFVDVYPEDGKEYRTYNRLRQSYPSGKEEVVEIGDDRPLIVGAYRIYANTRGFAPRLLWQADGGSMQLFSLDLGNIQPDGWSEGSSLTIPGGPQIWVSLDHRFERPPKGSALQNLGATQITSPIVVRTGNLRQELRPGESVQIDGGQISYRYLDSWIGYRVTYDPTIPWIAGTVGLAVLSLVWFYWTRKPNRTPEVSP
jgi:cytochrome c biogenesis protein